MPNIYYFSSIASLFADIFIVLLCSLAILGLLFRHMNIVGPVDPLHWQISQDAATSLFACLANTLGAAESVLRVTATGHDKRLFLKKSSLPTQPSSPLFFSVTALMTVKPKLMKIYFFLPSYKLQHRLAS